MITSPAARAEARIALLRAFGRARNCPREAALSSTISALQGHTMRVLAIIATYNEERFIGGCLENLFAQGVEAYLCDNSSTDATVAIAERYRRSGLRGIEHIPRDGVFRWREILERKQALAAELSADWFLHVDADEVPLPPRS